MAVKKKLIKVKKVHENAVIPKYAKDGDAGLDLTAVGAIEFDEATGVATYRTGLAIEIPKGFVGLIYPRSSINKMGCRLANCVGVIDSGYRGEILVKMDLSPYNILKSAGRLSAEGREKLAQIGNSNAYAIGERIAQLVIMPYPQIELVEAENLSQTSRGEKGFGSTGKK